MGDYVGDYASNAKTQNGHPIGGVGGVCMKYHPHMVFSFPIISLSVTENFAHVRD